VLGPGSRHATAGVPTSGRATGTAPQAAQAAGVVAAAARAAADRHGDVSASAAVSTAERAGSATAAAAAAAATAGFQAAFRSALPGGAAPPVAAGGGDIASASPPPSPNGHLPTALRPVVRGGEVAGWGGAATECHLAARPAPPTRAATRSPTAATATVPTVDSKRGSFSPGELLGVAT